MTGFHLFRDSAWTVETGSAFDLLFLFLKLLQVWMVTYSIKDSENLASLKHDGKWKSYEVIYKC